MDWLMSDKSSDVQTPSSNHSRTLFSYQDEWFPDYIRHGNAMNFIKPFADFFCKGVGYDIGCNKWPLPNAIGIDSEFGDDAMDLPSGDVDFIFSSHCLEHLPDPIAALEHWKDNLVSGGCLFLYLPHPDMVYWRPQWNRKHLHSWLPFQMRQIFKDLGFEPVIGSERDLYWAFCTVGYKP